MSKVKTPVPSVIQSAEGIEFTDKDIKVIRLDSGTYEIDGEIIEVPYSYGKQSVVVKDTKNIREITTEKYIEKYTNGSDFMSVEEYEETDMKLYDKYNSDEEKWKSLDDEFAYRKFKEIWNPIYNTIQTISKPLKVGIVKTKYNTGCKYIQNAYLSGENKDATLFTYNQNCAWLDTVSECFTELGMTYDGNCNYGKTEGKKIWGNSSHSCIRYVVAFGTYCMGERWQNPKTLTGTLEDMTKRYNEDREAIRSTIIKQYNKLFGKVDAGDFDFDGLLSKINTCISISKTIEPKQKSSSDHWKLQNKLKECNEMIMRAYKVDNEIK